MIVVIYIASLAANEKLPPIIIPPQRNFLLVLSFFLFIFDFGNFYKTSSSFSFAGDPYGWNRIKIFVEIKFKRCTILLPGNTAPQTGRVYGCTQNIPGETLLHTVSLYLGYFSLYS
jgi:hypothetical protein